MQLLYARCAGLDVHARQVVACVRIVVNHTLTYHRLTVATTTRGLLELADWLTAHEVTHVAMEATGVYWKPVWHLLEGQFALTLANAQHVKNVPGRKSDVNDAQWLADLLAVGLIRSSFVPPTRRAGTAGPDPDAQATRARDRAPHATAAEDSGGRQSQAHRNDQRHSRTEWACHPARPHRGRDRSRAIGGAHPRTQSVAHAVGRRPARTDHAASPLHAASCTWTQIEAIEDGLTTLEQRLTEALAPFRAACNLLKTMPGISDTVAAVLLAEIGDDLAPFPTAAHLVSWAGLAPRLDETAGKKRSTRTRPSAPWLKTTMVQAAWAAARTKDSYFHAQFVRLKSRRGPKKAIMAVAASMLTAWYHMLRNGVEFHDLGAQYFVHHDKDQITKRLLRRLRDLGVEVEIKNAA